MKKEELKNKVNGYIRQAVILHEKGNPAFYRTGKRMQAIDKLIIIAEQCKSLKPESVAAITDRNAEVFAQVLPHPAHKAHQTIKANLDKMLLHCATYNLTKVW